MTASEALGANARQVLIDIFRNKDVTAVGRYFADSLVQHDPKLADGIVGMKAFAAEIGSSPDVGITIYRTLVDGDRVLVHSRYEGLANAPGPLIALDLFRFADDTVVEAPAIDWPPSSHGPPRSSARPPACARRRPTGRSSPSNSTTTGSTKCLSDDYIQHAAGIGDGIEHLKARFAHYTGTLPVLVPKFYLAHGNFVLSVVDARTDPPTVNLDLFRITNGKIAEHWEVLSAVPPREQWKNQNRPF